MVMSLIKNHFNRKAQSVLFCFLLFFYSDSPAQHYDFTSILLYANTFDRLHIEHEGMELLHSRRSVSGELAVMRTVHLTEHWALSPSIGLGVMPFNINFDLSRDLLTYPEAGEAQSNMDLIHYEYIHFYYSLKLQLEYLHSLPTGNTLSMGAGIALNHFPARDYGIGVSLSVQGANEDYEIFRMVIEGDLPNFVPTTFVNVRYFFGGEFKDLFYCGALLNWGYSPVGMGQFEFSNVSVNSVGTLKWQPTWFGLTIGARITKHPYKKLL